MRLWSYGCKYNTGYTLPESVASTNKPKGKKMKIITDTKLKTELKKLKKEIFNEIPKELNIEIKGVYKLHIDLLDKNNKIYDEIRKNLKLRGFELKDTIKPEPIYLWTLRTYKTEIWEKDLGQQKY